jgi:hypothetical protein
MPRVTSTGSVPSSSYSGPSSTTTSAKASELAGIFLVEYLISSRVNFGTLLTKATGGDSALRVTAPLSSPAAEPS